MAEPETRPTGIVARRRFPALSNAATIAVLSLLAVVLFFPFVWMTLCAFAPQAELQTEVPLRRAFSELRPGLVLAPGEFANWARASWTTENFRDPERGTGLFDITAMRWNDFARAPVHGWLVGWQITPPEPGAPPPPPIPGARLLLWFENTLFTALAVTVLSVLINGLAAYAFARITFPCREPIFWMLLATVMIPGQVTLIPLFLLVSRGLGLHDSLWAVILPQVAAPVGIFLMRQYMRTLPSQLEEAARIDGCSEPGIFLRIIAPLSKPVLAVWAVFTFIGAWKAFLWPLVIISDQNRYLLEVGLKTLQFTAGPRNIGIVMAAALLASIPIVAVFLVFQRFLAQGMTVGAVKG